MTTHPSLNRQILALALPALATLITEPLLVIVDSAIIGHLGTVPLAGLSLATTVVGVLVGLAIFLAYGTTSMVARRLGAGDRRGALAAGTDGMVLALVLGVVLTVVVFLGAATITSWYAAPAEVQSAATAYLRIIAFAFPGVLVTLSSTGVLRGLQDTRTPLLVAIGVNLTNIVLTVSFVYGFDGGLAGAALGTAVAASCGGTVLATKVVRSAGRAGAPLGWRPRGVLSAAQAGGWLVLRSASLQVTILITTATASTMGTVSLAAHQVTSTVWNTMAFILDSLAIAAQALIGLRLGEGDTAGARAITRRLLWWAATGGLAVGGLLVLARRLLMSLFTSDPAVHAPLANVLMVLAVIVPLGGVVWILDGILIGAGDMRYLGLVATLTVLGYAPFAWLVWYYELSLVYLWAAYGLAITIRMVTLWVRHRGTRWMRIGA